MTDQMDNAVVRILDCVMTATSAHFLDSLGKVLLSVA